MTSQLRASCGLGSLVTRPRSPMASTARETQLFSRLTRAPNSDNGIGPERPSSVSRWHWVLVVLLHSATTRWARV